MRARISTLFSAQVSARMRRLRNICWSFYSDKWQSPQISAILCKTSADTAQKNGKLLARETSQPESLGQRAARASRSVSVFRLGLSDVRVRVISAADLLSPAWYSSTVSARRFDMQTRPRPSLTFLRLNDGAPNRISNPEIETLRLRSCNLESREFAVR